MKKTKKRKGGKKSHSGDCAPDATLYADTDSPSMELSVLEHAAYCTRKDSAASPNAASHMQADSYDDACDLFADQDLMAVLGGHGTEPGNNVSSYPTAASHTGHGGIDPVDDQGSMSMMADSDESNDALFQGPLEQFDADCASDSPDMQSVRSNLISSAATDPPDVDAMLLELHACTPSGRPRISEINDSLLCEMTPSDDVAPTDNTTDTADPKKEMKKCRKRGKRKLANADEDPASLMTDVDASAMEMSVADQDATTHKSTRGGRQRLRAACAWQKRNSVTDADSNDAGGEEDDDRLSS